MRGDVPPLPRYVFMVLCSVKIGTKRSWSVLWHRSSMCLEGLAETRKLRVFNTWVEPGTYRIQPRDPSRPIFAPFNSLSSVIPTCRPAVSTSDIVAKLAPFNLGSWHFVWWRASV
jgi:hypothetical protein